MNESQALPASAFPDDPAQQLEVLWQQGQRPDVGEFLSRAGNLTPAQVIAALCVDQWHRWQQGDRVPAEAYWQIHPAVQTAEDKAFDLVYGEFLLREEMGEEPLLDDFLKRFPQFAAEFQKQAKVHQAIESGSSPESTKIFSGISPSPLGGEAEVTVQGKGSESGAAPVPHPLSPKENEGILAAEADWPAIPGYTILSQIGQGGMGQVFKATQIRLDRVVALKVIRKECLSQEPKAARRFQREAQAAAHLSHPNIIVVYDFNQVGDTYYIAMEYVDGVDLDQLVREGGPLPVDRAVDFIRQAALGLQHAHACGMVHRDIKPSNLLIAWPKRERETRRQADKEKKHTAPLSLSPGQLQNATLKILDMGMALLLHGPQGESSHRTVQGTLMGTPDFIAPEQAVDSHEVDIRADLYSLGCTFYYLLAGRPPFSEYPLLKKLMMHQVAQAKSVREWRPDVPPEIEAIVQRLMAKAPEDRFQTPGDLVEALAAPSTEAIDPIFGPLAEAGLLKGSPQQPRGSKGGRSKSEEPSRVVRALGSEVVTSPGGPNPPAPFPTREEAEGDTLGPQSWTGHARSSISGPLSADRVAVLKGHPSWVMALAFSPNRKTLASGAVHGAVRLWNFSGRRHWEKADLETQLAEVHTLAFSPDNHTLAVGSGSFDGLIWLWDVSSPTPSHKAVLQGHQTPVEAIAFSPDGKMLVSGGSDKTVRWWDLGEPQIKERAVFKGHFDRIKAVAIGPDTKSRIRPAPPAVISASLDGTVRFWRKAGMWSKDQFEILEGPWGPVHTMALSPGVSPSPLGGEGQGEGARLAPTPHPHPLSPKGRGSILAFGGLDQTVRLFSLPTEKEGCQPLAVLRGHRGVIRLVAFTPKGNTLVSVCDVGRVIVWEIASGNKLQEWQLPAAKMCSVAVSHDARYLAAGTSDGVVNVFRLYTKTKEPGKSEAPA